MPEAGGAFLQDGGGACPVFEEGGRDRAEAEVLAARRAGELRRLVPGEGGVGAVQHGVVDGGAAQHQALAVGGQPDFIARVAGGDVLQQAGPETVLEALAVARIQPRGVPAVLAVLAARRNAGRARACAAARTARRRTRRGEGGARQAAAGVDRGTAGDFGEESQHGLDAPEQAFGLARDRRQRGVAQRADEDAGEAVEVEVERGEARIDVALEPAEQAGEGLAHRLHLRAGARRVGAQLGTHFAEQHQEVGTKTRLTQAERVGEDALGALQRAADLRVGEQAGDRRQAFEAVGEALEQIGGRGRAGARGRACRQAGDGLGDRFDQAAQLGERLWQARAEAGEERVGKALPRGLEGGQHRFGGGRVEAELVRDGDDLVGHLVAHAASVHVVEHLRLDQD